MLAVRVFVLVAAFSEFSFLLELIPEADIKAYFVLCFSANGFAINSAHCEAHWDRSNLLMNSVQLNSS